MLRFRPPFLGPVSAPTRHPKLTFESLSFGPDATAPCTDDAVCVHVDYDRHPLGVLEFEHYIAPVERDERFHVR